ncbi:acyl-ACP thioesterase domain-containing protein [Patulibacter sp. SYSU D01012]|uniref:acyl-ACP thioesterase domain-containing protein n=1 Tax=Patulibacter sp. SYSU D01012 TaxID=2817381 RepID=UPI001B303945|nr:acyl-ACP thioesterase domain-containing protein [Patulibacter sp. SYSU D01012]
MTALEIAPFPTAGRVHRAALRVGPGATTPPGRARLDAVVDWLQQVAYEDVVDAGLEGESLWVVRRTQVVARRFPVFGERLELRTAASGTGPLVTERRTSIAGERGAAVEAAALWVPLDPATLRPRRTEAVEAVYGASAAGRRVKARLRHPTPPDDAVAVDWRFDRADLDVAGHVNNAAYWRALEEELGEHPADAPLAVEVEHPAPAFAGPARLLRAGDRRWLVGADGTVHASALLVAGA